MRAHSAFARSFRRKISAPRFYGRRNRVLDIDEISGAPSGGAICGQGSGLQSIWHRHWQGDGLAEHRHPQKEKRRTMPRLFRTGARTGNKTWRDVGADYLEPYRTSRCRLCRARSDVTWFALRIKRTPSPDFSSEGVVIWQLTLLFLAATRVATLFAFAAGICLRAHGRRSKSRCQAGNK